MSVIIEFCSIVSTVLFGQSVRTYGDYSSSLFMAFFMFLSIITVCLVPAKFRREEVEKVAGSTELREFLTGQQKKPIIITAS